MAAALVHLAADTPGPSYLRIDKGPFTPLYAPGTDFSAGMARVRAGRDVTIVATGVMVTQALAVAEALGRDGIDAGLVDVYRLKPVDADALLEHLAGTRKVVVLEEHSVLGGLGGLVCEIVAERDRTLRVRRLGVPDVYHPEVGSRDWLRALDGLDVPGITASIRRFLVDA
jgi:transketolase